MSKTTKIFNTLVSADDALDMILSKLRSVSGTEIIPVADADLRILSEDIKSSINVPAFDRGAMDGFAVRSADLEEPGMFKIIGQSMAGQPFQ